MTSLAPLSYKIPDGSKEILEIVGSPFPNFNPEAEEAAGKLKYKIMLDKHSKVPGLIIHTAKPLTNEEMEEFADMAYELIPKVSSLNFDEEYPFVIFETHSYCTNLIEHTKAIYNLLHKVQYGTLNEYNHDEA